MRQNAADEFEDKTEEWDLEEELDLEETGSMRGWGADSLALSAKLKKESSVESARPLSGMGVEVTTSKTAATVAEVEVRNSLANVVVKDTTRTER